MQWLNDGVIVTECNFFPWFCCYDCLRNKVSITSFRMICLITSRKLLSYYDNPTMFLFIVSTIMKTDLHCVLLLFKRFIDRCYGLFPRSVRARSVIRRETFNCYCNVVEKQAIHSSISWFVVTRQLGFTLKFPYAM